MRQSRAPIKLALTALMEGVTFGALSGGETKFVKVSRRVRLWTEVMEQPALFIAVHAENDSYQSENLPSKTTLNAELFVYFKTNDPELIPQDDLDLILDGIDAALKPDIPTNRQTLGGLVSHCRREGKVLLDPGDIDGQGIALIPITIFVP